MIKDDQQNNLITIESLPYGSIVQYKNKRYYKCEGMDGDILMSEGERGTWLFIKEIKWESFKILFTPPPLKKEEIDNIKKKYCISKYVGEFPLRKWIFVKEFEGTLSDAKEECSRLQKEDSNQNTTYYIWDNR
jgi:hypothetical protein